MAASGSTAEVAHPCGAAPREAAAGLPFDKLCCSLAVPRPATPAVLVACGSFNPPTFMHLRMFDVAIASLQRAGHDVWGGYMSPVADAYAKPGLAEAGHRVRMCQLSAAGKPHVMVDPWEALQPEYTRTLEVLRKIRQQLSDGLLPPTGGASMQTAGGCAAATPNSSNGPSSHLEADGGAAAAGNSITSFTDTATCCQAATKGADDAVASARVPARDAASEGAEGAAGSTAVALAHRHDRRVQEGEQSSRASILPKVLLLCGADVLASMAIPGVWEDLPGIFCEFGVVCVTRAGTNIRELLNGDGGVLREYAKHVHVVEDDVGALVSSSLVRAKLARGESVEGLVDAGVAAYIFEQGLYSRQQQPHTDLKQ